MHDERQEKVTEREGNARRPGMEITLREKRKDILKHLNHSLQDLMLCPELILDPEIQKDYGRLGEILLKTPYFRPKETPRDVPLDIDIMEGPESFEAPALDTFEPGSCDTLEDIAERIKDFSAILREGSPSCKDFDIFPKQISPLPESLESEPGDFIASDKTMEDVEKDPEERLAAEEGKLKALKEEINNAPEPDLDIVFPEFPAERVLLGVPFWAENIIVIGGDSHGRPYYGITGGSARDLLAAVDGFINLIMEQANTAGQQNAAAKAEGLEAEKGGTGSGGEASE